MKKRIFALFLTVAILCASSGFSVAAAPSGSFLPDSNPFETIEKIQKIIEDSFVEGVRRFIDFFAFDCDFIFSKRYIQETGDEISALRDGFIPQGLCRVEALDCFAISGYTDDGSDSRIFLDNGEKQRTVILKGYTGHAGGIASYGGDIYVCSGGSENSFGHIYRLEIEDIKDIFNNEAETVEAEFSGRFETYVKASFMGTGDGKLWVGEFCNKDNKVDPSHKKGDNNALCFGYDLPLPDDAFDDAKPVPSVALSVPDQVQGMAVKSDGNVIFSTSYGRRNSSFLQVFDDYDKWEKSSIKLSGNETELPLYISDKDHRIAKMNMPTLMEGIVCDYNGLYCIFESGAKKYSNAREIIDSVVRYDLDRMLAVFR